MSNEVMVKYYRVESVMSTNVIPRSNTEDVASPDRSSGKVSRQPRQFTRRSSEVLKAESGLLVIAPDR